MKKWFLKAFFLLSATMLLTTGLFELYSKMPVCEERENGRGAMNDSCLPYDQVLAGDYRVRKGQVYWEDREYAPEKNCGFGYFSILANITSFKCLLDMKGYIRTVEHRTLTKLEKLSPAFRVLESKESGLLDWQKEQFGKYAVGEQGVYFEGKLLEGVDPKDFTVVFPLGDEEHWRFLDVFRSGNSTFVGGKNLGDVDLSHFRLLETPSCLKPNAQCAVNELARLFNGGDGVVGSVDNDIIILGTYWSARAENKASPTMSSFLRGSERYISSQGVLYHISPHSYELVKDSGGEHERRAWFLSVYKPHPQDSREFLPWQQEQFLDYSIGGNSVYFKGTRLEGAGPQDFKVVFPFGPEAQWGKLSLSTSGGNSFVNRWKVKNADFDKLQLLPPCTISEEGLAGDCWTSEQMIDSIDGAGLVAQLGEDVFYFGRDGAQRFIGAVSPGFYVFERGGHIVLSSRGARYEMRRYVYGTEEIDVRQRQAEQGLTESCPAPASGLM